MTVGLKIPVGPDKQGRAKTVDGVEYTKQTIITSLRNCESRNPFQDLGLGNTMIFDINDETTTTRIVIRIEEIFASLEIQEIAKLGSSSTKQAIEFETIKEGELDVIIRYIDLEVNRPEEITLNLPSDFGG